MEKPKASKNKAKDVETMLGIKPETLQKVVNYLVRCPFGEVNGLIGLLQNCRPIKEKDKENAPD